jgi:hypothetical protein
MSNDSETRERKGKERVLKNRFNFAYLSIDFGSEHSRFKIQDSRLKRDTAVSLSWGSHSGYRQAELLREQRGSEVL